MSVWSRFAKIDSALQRGLDNGFAFVFGGKLVASEVEDALKQCSETEALSHEDGRVVVPHIYTLTVSSTDHENLLRENPRIEWDLSDRLTRFFRNNQWSTAGTVRVVINSDDSLRTGQLKTHCSSESSESPEFPKPDSDSPSSSIHEAGTHREDRRGDAAASPSQEPSPVAQWGAEGQRELVDTHANCDPEQVGDGYSTQAEHTQIFDQGYGNGAGDGYGEGYPPAEPEPTVTLLLQDGSSRTHVVQHGTTVIGRSNSADFRLPDTGVSRQHAEITWDGYDAVIVDLQSTNGTTVNDVPVENWLLADGDVINVGHSYIEVRITGAGR